MIRIFPISKRRNKILVINKTENKMSGIGPHIDKWEDERAEMADKCLNCFANYIMFLPRVVFDFYSRPKVN
jgi:hypothetical protein